MGAAAKCQEALIFLKLSLYKTTKNGALQHAQISAATEHHTHDKANDRNYVKQIRIHEMKGGMVNRGMVKSSVHGRLKNVYE